MTKIQIEAKQRRIAKALQKTVHPDNPLAQDMVKRYRELETLKESAK
jgi:hypothetical protein